MYSIGIDVGGTNLAAGLVNDRREIVARANCPVPERATGETLCAALSGLGLRLLREFGIGQEKVSTLGIGLPGEADNAAGVSVRTVNLPLNNVPLRAWLGRDWSVPIHLGNDADCAAVGEFFAGGAARYRSMVMVTLGTGVGGGVVLGGKLAPGSELGHMVIKTGGRACNCGRRGCFERYASATGLCADAAEVMAAAPDSLLWQLCGGRAEAVTGKLVFDALAAGDAAAGRVVDAYLRNLAVGLANIANILRPEAICLGGGVAGAPDALFLHPLRALVEAELSGLGTRVVLVKALLGNDAGILGAALLS